MTMVRRILAIFAISQSALEALGVPLERSSVTCTLAGTKVRHRIAGGKFDLGYLMEVEETVTV